MFGCFKKKSNNNFNKMEQKLVNEIKKFKWDEIDKITSLIEPYIEISNSTNVKIGCSKFGGRPDLPKEFYWPMFENKPMVFYGQINLSEISNFGIDSVLPPTGILYFFSYFKNPENEFGAEYNFLMDKKKYKVLFYDGELNSLKSVDFPNDLISDYQFKDMPISFNLDYNIPSYYDIWKVENADLSKADIDTYFKLTSNGDYYRDETILGTPSPIQAGVDYDWAYASMDLDLSTVDFNDPSFKAEVNKLRPEFINLLSFSMDDRFESIGISLCYFGITKTDLKNKNFDKVIFVMQDT